MFMDHQISQCSDIPSAYSVNVLVRLPISAHVAQYRQPCIHSAGVIVIVINHYYFQNIHHLVHTFVCLWMKL